MSTDAEVGDEMLSQAEIQVAEWQSELDGTAKGGVALAIAGELGLPIWFIGTGEKSSDMAAFDPEAFAGALLPDSPSAN